MRLANKTLTFHVNDTPLTDGIPKVEGSPLFFTLQMHRKGDSITLLREQFDEKTVVYLKHFCWGKVSMVAEGPLIGHPTVHMERQLTSAIACHNGSDFHGDVVPSVVGAKVVDAHETAVWNVEVINARKAIYIGIEREDWGTGLDWWCDAAIGHTWYYGSDGSLRNGNQVVAKSQLLTRTVRASAVTPEGEDEEHDGFQDGFPHERNDDGGKEGMMEEDYYEPFIPHIREKDVVGVRLQNKVLTFTHNREPVEGKITGVCGKVRLAVQMEEDGDAVALLPE
eukprot:CAMPEP_0181291326 /NCGR_PEP_ID=MMETSP1101-20121128/1906_1 /TAXON_ID=46948 /ORGANISM="Rhodomonas abbreviata, Strain Caron Lab Isolate" /LENGTH=280 /DNA_ID=CAMNT_0023395707 /DNA_START=31 /DNA_END=873 /DNA_ORIENTATION=+